MLKGNLSLASAWSCENFLAMTVIKGDTAHSCGHDGCGPARAHRSAWRDGLLTAIVLAVLGTPQVGRADDEHEPDVRGAPVASLMLLLERVGRDFEGDVLELELEQEDGRPVYEVKLLTPKGNVLKVYYDARTLDVLEVKGRHEDHGDDPHRGKDGGS